MGAVEEMMCVVCVLQRGHSGDGCDLASTLCKYDLRKGDLFVLSWKRVRWGSMLMCGGGVQSMLLLPLVARCIETIDVCIWRLFVLCLFHHADVVCLCPSCGSAHCCIMHDLLFVNAGQGCKRTL